VLTESGEVGLEAPTYGKGANKFVNLFLLRWNDQTF